MSRMPVPRSRSSIAHGRRPANAMSPASRSPRLPPAHARQRLAGSAIGNDTAYADVEVSGESFATRTLKKLTLERAVLKDLDLRGARLEGLRLLDVRVESCDLANAVWRDASMHRVEFIGCRVTGLDAAELSATGLRLHGCVGALTSFRFASLKQARFEDCALTEADFGSATLVETVFRGCDLRGAIVVGARVQGADFRGCDLDDLRMRSGDLAGAIIDPTQLIAVARSLAAVLGIVVCDPDSPPACS
jgi:uncharacterized protein YjbI with pentapeptide repeats